MIGMTLFFLFTIGFVNYFLYRDTKRFSSAYEELDLERIIPFLEEKGGNHLSHLIILQDKDVYWAQDGRVLIAYKKIGNKLVVLGDPIGEESSIQAAIREFNQYSKSIGLTPVFYQISPRFMHYYHDTGYRFLKLGEEAIVSLDKFTLEGKQGARLRTRLNKFNRNSYTFNVIHPPYSNDLLSELRVISDSWLGEQKEKGFSVVSFSEEYVSCFPIACVSDPEGNIVAFATLANDYKKTMTIDLMSEEVFRQPAWNDGCFIYSHF
ncbi:hypothetical protein GCM10009865_38910 [Aeromicrobium ponti]|uniref:Phosphatidylglycerol lysyltransferase n=1 Tax=Cytobacillus oceanisediminis TaxID=665099 RepID=A0A562JJ25_9BACI|nr:phosphatidylglycerol lysyltransferase domain-containing protein [Cytobacillus oceanisediminis]TWH83108.1 phosphatidylglycerol lysyltransferase [Cytobacillus oceanisediminis]